MSKNQVVLLKQMIDRAQKQIETATKMMQKIEKGDDVDISSLSTRAPRNDSQEEGEIVEGIFDGVNMIGNDAKQYTIPANYASKSKLVEGDVLKLTILDDGSFLYKQIGPIERKRVRGTLMQDDDTGEYSVMAQGNAYKVLSASITYFKGEVGDEVIILIPSDKQSQWAAVENIIKSLDDGTPDDEDSADEVSQDALDKATSDLL
ncbi:MAG: hypothetical protein CO042_01085 [Parcubacteria group bacterium CG_4_9_14_0_2_um_filter_41_8]|nr:MAG: hypothetical protein AUJ34_00655 [Parcubacteria group bacterium CG1_02_41_12]PIP66992.1 MAG: hypothetical protein COW93_02630 [Parcubacteria group bacterium CG22_combo_CG10-13_8_21_14_all_41_9]PIQ80233.1 MAG: hypothetical protein COV79_01545 [Parcubacteria group bacterium CG11_big_fil_rev_8_21_14_0_20_41_14]PIZ82032.1 MAG: hypothetical protein COY02_00780 [Parcubacteria group bacterium CG_4_10_14_0_2_um_filter_41_6]PJC40938.1 MAG: hypothetical protein CO042_01085 [Parcubacteria group ba